MTFADQAAMLDMTFVQQLMAFTPWDWMFIVAALGFQAIKAVFMFRTV